MATQVRDALAADSSDEVPEPIRKKGEAAVDKLHEAAEFFLRRRQGVDADRR